jgi:hypothetical protein
MTKEDAQAILDRYVKIHGWPIKDVVVNRRDKEQWTFRGLLMIAYDLKDNRDGKN